MRRSAAVLLLAAVWAGAPRVEAATCSVSPGGIALVADIPGGLRNVMFPTVEAVAIPVDIDAAAGTFTIRREGLPMATAQTPGGAATVDLDGTTAPGTIDADGSVTVPDFPIETVFLGLPLTVDLQLTTLPQSQTIAGVEYPHAGRPLDFATGLVTLVGIAILPNAPIVETPVVTGVQVTCRLDDVPSASALPAAPRIRKLSGKVKNGAGGSTLVLRAVLERPGTANPQEVDAFVTLSDAGGTTVAEVFGRVVRKGTRARPVREAAVVVGYAGEESESTPIAGTLAVRKSGRSTVVALKSRPLALSTLAGDAAVAITVPPHVARAAVTVQGGRIKLVR